MQLILALFLLCNFMQICLGFNLGTNVNSRVVHRGTKNTMFGYDVAMHKNGPEEYTLLVGAPRANSGQPGVVRGGAVYKCSSLSSRCTVQYFDRKGHTEELHGSRMIQTGSKSDQWFGATIVTLDTDDPNNDAVIACAPHYLYYGTKNEFREPTGNCFYANQSFRNIKEFSPCKLKMKHGFHRLGFCMAGFSAAIGHDYHAYLGAPGAYYWGGALLSVQTSFERHRRPQYTLNGSKEHDDQFMGYSTAVGDFDGDQIDDVAIGLPRGSELKGQVNLYVENMRNIFNLTGEQLGSYFGASIAVTDLNNDGRHDIIVGAPLYTKIEKSSAGVRRSTYEIGRVYVYLQSSNHKFDQFIAVNGQKEWGRFGFDVAAAGDLNQDDYNDFIVGAPYDGYKDYADSLIDFIVGAPYDGIDRKSGAIYIFNGAKGGFREKFSQVIYGQTIQASIETFGFSVAAGRDVDNNGYPDIIVGAYKSDIAVLFKSRPVINMKGNIHLRPAVIKLDQKDCMIKDRSSGNRRKDTKVSCAKMQICTTYSGKKVSPDLDIKFLITLDAAKPHEPRAKFLTSGGSSMSVEAVMIANEQRCEPAEIYVEEGIRDKLSPILIHVNYSVVEERYKRDALVPVVSSLEGGFLKEELKIFRDCGTDDQCIPDLQIPTVFLSRTSLPAGADEKFNLSLVVKNNLEPAYEAYLFAYTPKGMDLEESLDLKNRTFTCDRQITSDEIKGYDVTRCNLGNPMAGRGSTFNVVLTYATKFFEGPYENVPLYIKVNSTSNETIVSNNNRTVNISFSLDADLEVFAGNNSYVFDVATTKDPKTYAWDEDIGPLVNHTYELVNTGNSTLIEVLVDIYFPSHTYDGQPLLYIIDDLKLHDNYEQTHCQLYQKGNINPNHYGIEKKTSKSRMVKREAPSLYPVQQSEQQPRSFLKFLSMLKEKASNFKIRGLMSQRKFNCFEMNCTQWRCTVKNFRKGFRLRITVESRLWTSTMVNEGFYSTTISSVIIAQVSKLSHKAPGGLDLPIKHAVATTTVTASDPSRVKRGIPWWLILIAVLAGLALLILLTLLLWRCGFFKRKRPPRGQALLAKPSEAEFYGYSTYSPANPNYPTHSENPYGQRL